MMETQKPANTYQVDGDHYRNTEIQHWDFAASNNFDYFQGQITKYVTRWKSKNGVKDLEKAKHFLEKYLELETQKIKKNQLPPIHAFTRDLPQTLMGSVGKDQVTHGYTKKYEEHGK